MWCRSSSKCSVCVCVRLASSFFFSFPPYPHMSSTGQHQHQRQLQLLPSSLQTQLPLGLWVRVLHRIHKRLEHLRVSSAGHRRAGLARLRRWLVRHRVRHGHGLVDGVARLLEPVERPPLVWVVLAAVLQPHGRAVHGGHALRAAGEALVALVELDVRHAVAQRHHAPVLVQVVLVCAWPQRDHPHRAVIRAAVHEGGLDHAPLLVGQREHLGHAAGRRVARGARGLDLLEAAVRVLLVVRARAPVLPPAAVGLHGLALLAAWVGHQARRRRQRRLLLDHEARHVLSGASGELLGLIALLQRHVGQVVQRQTPAHAHGRALADGHQRLVLGRRLHLPLLLRDGGDRHVRAPLRGRRLGAHAARQARPHALAQRDGVGRSGEHERGRDAGHVRVLHLVRSARVDLRVELSRVQAECVLQPQLETQRVNPLVLHVPRLAAHDERLAAHQLHQEAQPPHLVGSHLGGQELRVERVHAQNVCHICHCLWLAAVLGVVHVREDGEVLGVQNDVAIVKERHTLTSLRRQLALHLERPVVQRPPRGTHPHHRVLPHAQPIVPIPARCTLHLGLDLVRNWLLRQKVLHLLYHVRGQLWFLPSHHPHPVPHLCRFRQRKRRQEGDEERGAHFHPS
mmetsp:Transcript_11153/g.35464  ORF Transcript_11153/g.35464 Transcript_11153/m.35464 type:complete len:626 (-) Transcript_11153:12-1889(-)